MPDAPELDGVRGWLVVAAAALASFVAFGVLFTFGIFVEPIGEEFGVGKGPVAVMFALAAGVYYFFGAIAGRLSDRFGPRPVLTCGGVSLVVGLMLTAATPSLTMAYFSFGLLVGPGVACCYAPMVATAAGWFDRKRTFAMGVASAGVGMGTLIMAPVGARLESALGWRGALWAYAGGSAVLLSLAVAGAMRRPGADSTQLEPLGPVLRSPTFRILFVASTLLSLAFYTPFVFLSAYVEDNGGSASSGATLVGIIGAMSVASRLLFGALGSRWSPTGLYRLSYVFMAASFVVWLAAGSSYGMLVLHTVVMGLGYGGFVALAPAVLAERFGVERLGGLIGTLYTSFGFGGLAGPSINGFLIDRSGYGAALTVSLIAIILALVVMIRLR